MFRFKYFLLIITFIINSCATIDSNFSIDSPDGNASIRVKNDKGIISYALLKNGEELIKLSKISIFSDVLAEVKSSKFNAVNETWKPVWGQFSEIENHYNELILDIKLEKTKAKLYIRVYNHGIGFRYEVEGFVQGTEVNFYCEYNLQRTDNLYSPAGERTPIGPVSMDELITIKDLPKLLTPIVVENSNESYLSILESDLYVAPEFGTIKFNFNQNKKVLFSSNKSILTGNKVTTPWRVILINENIGDLVTNTIPLNLATPNQIEDPSWIQPGKALWDWRVHDYKTVDGFIFGINTESYVRFIDFASEKGIPYFLIDANWFTKVTKGHFEIAEKLDVEMVSDYAKRKGVKLILYYDRHKGDFGDAELFPYFKSLGMSGIKYGFMGNDVSFSKEAIQQSAANHLLVNFHDGPVPFTGMQRTYPNSITREYCHAQQDSRRAFTPETFIRMALINAIQGPLDMNNGNFDLTGINNGDRLKGPIKQHSYFSTVVSEVARTLIIFSGLVCLPDAPEAYQAKADLFEFILKMPVGKWEESKVLKSKIDEYVSTARRFGEDWFIGSVSNQQGGELDIDLDFLKEGKKYRVTYYEDTEETHGMKNPEAYQIRTGIVKKGDVVKAIMAPGGGHCMWIKPE